jgi:hypothetical protein
MSGLASSSLPGWYDQHRHSEFGRLIDEVNAFSPFIIRRKAGCDTYDRRRSPTSEENALYFCTEVYLALLSSSELVQKVFRSTGGSWTIQELAWLSVDFGIYVDETIIAAKTPYVYQASLDILTYAQYNVFAQGIFQHRSSTRSVVPR